MSAVSVLVLGSVKAMLLLAVATAVTLMMRQRPARLRAVVWGTALIGALLLPLLSAVVPSMPVVLPFALPGLTAAPGETAPTSLQFTAMEPNAPRPATVHGTPDSAALPTESAASALDLETVLLAVWLSGLILLLVQQAASLWRMQRIVRRARPISETSWSVLADVVADQVGCRRRVELVNSREVDIPSVFGLARPVVILPAHADTWLEERRTAVLQHELIHVVRFDWPVRVAARLAAAFYWFNPLAWWAIRRLDLEQEMACDEEVLSLGSRASSYACHLLGIARSAVARPFIAAAGLEMARRSHLEERIMTILNRRHHHRVGFRLILPAAVIVAALVPAIAAVQPTDPGPRTPSRELAAVLEEMRETEEMMAPTLKKITEWERELQPSLEVIQAIEADIDHEAIARIEESMRPILEQIKAVEIDMAPLHAELEAIGEAMRDVKLHIEDGTLEEIQEQIHEQLEAHRHELEAIHVELEPYHHQLQELQTQLEPMHSKIAELNAEELARIREQVERSREVMEREREAMVRFEVERARVHEELEPLHEEMERLGDRLEQALRGDVAAMLESHLGPVTGPTAPFVEAAARLLDGANIHLDEGLLEVDISRREAREILTDLFASARVGTQDAFDAALEAAVDEVSDLEIRAD